MIIKSYGDTLNDGAVQLSFTLPVKYNAKAKEAAKLFVLKLGFETCEIVHARAAAENFTFFVIYGKTNASIDYNKVEHFDAVDESMSMYEIDDFIKNNLKRKLTIVGACTGFDAHTVGIDAIMNMKGYNLRYGFERYKMVKAYNLGAQVQNEDLIKFAAAHKADVILVSQIVTQKEVHIHNLTNLIELLEAEKLRDKFIVIIGGPRVNNKLALELGFDAGFGYGTYSNDVGTFIVKKLKGKSLHK
jgi:beta-lysine 5,6-aminomutase beta subunit